MSNINVNNISNGADTGPTSFTTGLTVGVGAAITTTGDTVCNVTGTITATEFLGDGGNLNNLPVNQNGDVFFYRGIFSIEDTFRA
tara:strand:- start:152 stop:406 length:255 start_codon:yes stop_codon:yes gene_type:complete